MGKKSRGKNRGEFRVRVARNHLSEGAKKNGTGHEKFMRTEHGY